MTLIAIVERQLGAWGYARCRKVGIALVSLTALLAAAWPEVSTAFVDLSRGSASLNAYVLTVFFSCLWMAGSAAAARTSSGDAFENLWRDTLVAALVIGILWSITSLRRDEDGHLLGASEAYTSWLLSLSIGAAVNVLAYLDTLWQTVRLRAGRIPRHWRVTNLLSISGFVVGVLALILARLVDEVFGTTWALGWFDSLVGWVCIGNTALCLVVALVMESGRSDAARPIVYFDATISSSANKRQFVLVLLAHIHGSEQSTSDSTPDPKEEWRLLLEMVPRGSNIFVPVRARVTSEALRQFLGDSKDWPTEPGPSLITGDILKSWEAQIAEPGRWSIQPNASGSEPRATH